MASESSFEPDSNKGKRGSAKGLLQLLPTTIKYLNGEKNELKDHIFEFEESESHDPNVNIAAGVRWLFRKHETASSRLKRKASWEEAVAEYKDYLRRKIRSPKSKQKGMAIFDEYLKKLHSKRAEEK